MGACATISKKNKDVSVPVAAIAVLKKSIVIKISTTGSIEKIPITVPGVLYKHSASVYSSRSQLSILGGFDDTQNCIVNDALKLSLDKLTLEYLPSLPFDSKYGEAHCFEDTLYYIGGVRSYNDQFYPTPFLRLKSNESAWEILEEQPRQGKNITISSQLFRPGSCLNKSCLYIIGGEVMIPNYNKCMNTQTYKLDLRSLEVSLLNFVGVSCIAPKCLEFHGQLLLLGKNADLQNFIATMAEQLIIKELPFRFKDSVKLLKLKQDIIILAGDTKATLKDNKLNLKVEKLNTQDMKTLDEISSIENSKSRSAVPVKSHLISKYYGNNC